MIGTLKASILYLDRTHDVAAGGGCSNRSWNDKRSNVRPHRALVLLGSLRLLLGLRRGRSVTNL